MLQKPPGHHKSRSSGLNPGKGWELECLSISSREQTNHTLLTEEFEPRNRMIHIKNSVQEHILPPKNGFRHIGFKNQGKKRTREAVKSELPTLVTYQVTQINPILLKYQDYMAPPPSIRNDLSRNARSGNGYYLKPIVRHEHDRTSDIKNHSLNLRNKSHRSVNEKPEGNSMYELAMSRLNYWPALDGISEESPVNSDTKHRSMIDHDSSMEISNRAPLHNSAVKANKGAEASARNITTILKKQNELKKNLEALRSMKKETAAKADGTADYYGGNTMDMSFKEGEYKIDRWGLPNINTLLGTESALPSTRNNLDVPKREEKKFHKDSFMKMIYKGLGKNAQNVHKTSREQAFEMFCEEKRMTFRKKLEELKHVKK